MNTGPRFRAYDAIPVTSLSLAIPAALPGAESVRRAWPGVDETVVERVAVEAGRPPREPLWNTGQGDLPLFLFLLAGAAGGFVMGYCFRGLFGSRRRDPDGHE